GTLSNDATYDLVIHAERAVLPDGVDSARIGVRDGRIVEIAGGGAELNEAPRRGWTSSRSAPTRCCCLDSWTPTSTSTIPVAPNGRASPAPPEPPRPEESRRSSTCR